MTKQKEHIYIASDFHLGIHSDQGSNERALKIIAWLDEVKNKAKTIILLGDTFDYWFEFGSVIPKGFEAILQKLKEIGDSDTELIMFTGNHDMWISKYIEEHIGAKIVRDAVTYNWNGTKIFMAHGDGLGPGDYTYKLIKRIFRNKICQFLFRQLQPTIGLGIMKFCSKKSRESQDNPPFDIRSERLIKFVEKHADNFDVDYYIMGHRHLPIKYQLKDNKGIYYNCGDWINHFSYLEFDGKELYLKFYQTESEKIYGN